LIHKTKDYLFTVNNLNNYTDLAYIKVQYYIHGYITASYDGHSALKVLKMLKILHNWTSRQFCDARKWLSVDEFMSKHSCIHRRVMNVGICCMYDIVHEQPHFQKIC